MLESSSQILYVMLALPTLFGLTLVGEGVYKMTHFEHGWFSVVMGVLFLIVVILGYFYLRDLI
jgi:hypothetical protein